MIIRMLGSTLHRQSDEVLALINSMLALAVKAFTHTDIAVQLAAYDAW